MVLQGSKANLGSTGCLIKLAVLSRLLVFWCFFVFLLYFNCLACCSFCLSKGLLSRIETKPMRLSELTYYLPNEDEHHDIKSS
jgi:hypothetical protein